ncbi:MAG: hypothetical protein ACYC61_26320 [Isosphaeraceae bacterium]
MRCEEVERELAAPTTGCDRAAMADHLAVCPSCAAWAQDAERLDRLWEATRPAEPSAEAWDTVWSGISAALDRPGVTPGVGAAAGATSRPQPVRVLAPGEPGEVRAHPRHRPRTAAPRWSLGAVALVGLAQAAAILVAFGLAWQPAPQPNGPDAVAGADAGSAPKVAANPGAPTPIRADRAVRVDAEIDEGYLVVIHARTADARVENATPPEMNTGSDGGLVFLNVMESLATPHVASR